MNQDLRKHTPIRLAANDYEELNQRVLRHDR